MKWAISSKTSKHSLVQIDGLKPLVDVAKHMAYRRASFKNWRSRGRHGCRILTSRSTLLMITFTFFKRHHPQPRSSLHKLQLSHQAQDMEGFVTAYKLQPTKKAWITSLSSRILTRPQSWH